MGIIIWFKDKRTHKISNCFLKNQWKKSNFKIIEVELEKDLSSYLRSQRKTKTKMFCGGWILRNELKVTIFLVWSQRPGSMPDVFLRTRKYAVLLSAAFFQRQSTSYLSVSSKLILCELIVLNFQYKGYIAKK